LQSRGVEVLSKPTVDITQQLPRFVSLPLLFPRASETGGGVEFEEFGLLITSDREGLVETGCGLIGVDHCMQVFRIKLLGMSGGVGEVIKL